VIFVDSNVPMYLIGSDHPNKGRAREVLERLLGAGERLVTDAEMLQEILHRYVAIRRSDAIAPALELVTAVIDEVFPIDADDVRQASLLLSRPGRLSARDALHLAVMARHGVNRIFTFDTGFDDVPGVTRVS
jgi:uncharacterized protein